MTYPCVCMSWKEVCSNRSFFFSFVTKYVLRSGPKLDFLLFIYFLPCPMEIFGFGDPDTFSGCKSFSRRSEWLVGWMDEKMPSLFLPCGFKFVWDNGVMFSADPHLRRCKGNGTVDVPRPTWIIKTKSTLRHIYILFWTLYSPDLSRVEIRIRKKGVGEGRKWVRGREEEISQATSTVMLSSSWRHRT